MKTRPAGRGGPSPTLQLYLEEINRTPLLRQDQEEELARRVREGDPAARDHLVRANLRLVVAVARRCRGRGVPLEDLVAEGNLGLIRAVEAFDPSLGTRFSTYASYWIKQSIERLVINTAKAIRLPAYVEGLLAKWRRAAAALAGEQGRPPADAEVALRLGLPAKKLKVVQQALSIRGALVAAGGEEGEALPESLADHRAKPPAAALVGADEAREALRLLGRLGARSAAVLRLRFGLGGEGGLTLAEVGDRLGLTGERVRQIEQSALAELAGMMSGG
jgi:RNA polymerase primary sigma factor